MTKYKIHEATLSLEIAEEDFEMQSKTSESAINKYSLRRPIMNILSGEKVCLKWRYPDNRRKSHCLNSIDVISNQIRRILQVQKEGGQFTSKATSTKLPCLAVNLVSFLQSSERSSNEQKWKIRGGGGGGGGWVGKERKSVINDR